MMSQQRQSTAPAVTELLVGREAELERVAAFLHSASTQGAALLLTGEPGVGKSALLEVAGQRLAADGGRVVRAAGIQFEAAVTFSALDQLVAPLRTYVAQISPAYRTALNVALGLAGGRSPSFSVVGNATLALFRRAAAERALLIVVDDAQWLDPPSASVLSFVARRLSGSRVGLLAAARTELGGVLDTSGLPELEVHPLDGESAARLLGAHHPELAPAVRQRVLVEAGGNPMALRELPAGLSLKQQSARHLLPATLPLNRRLDAVFTSQLDALPEASRDLLLVLALEGSGDLSMIQATQAGDVLPLLAPAERTRLVVVDASTLR